MRSVVNGVPVGRITWVMVALVGAFLAASVAFAVTGNADLAHSAFGTATGMVVGSGVAVGVTINANRTTTDDKSDSAGKAA